MKSEPKIHLNDFNGPLELLLQLIHKNRMSIYNIQITTITQQYLSSLKKMHNLNLSLFGNFIVMATRLMYIKSRMLLPRSHHDQDKDADPRSNLVQRLVVYKRYKKVARDLHHLEMDRNRLHTRSTVIPSHSNHFINLQNQMDVRTLKKVFYKVVQRRVQRQPVHENINEWRYSVKSQSKLIVNLLKRHGQISFKAVFSREDSLEKLITNFLTVLDLIKDHLIVMTKRSMQLKLVR